ncbi:MAG: PAS domain S-box protein [Deltaproteobacteria bacterium]|nr:PAS domain S-box protein [Deltaproteobacteria bacterium]
MTNAQILIVEDEGFEAMLIQDALKRLGYGIAGIVPSGEEAVKKAEELRPDLVLMDIVLKGKMDGIEAANQIHKCCDIPVIYLTGLTGDQLLERVELTEPFGYILKPFQERELHTVIEIALYKHRLEKKLEESEERFHAVAESAADAIICLKSPDIIYFWNKKAEEMFGYSAADVMGKTLHNLIVPEKYREKSYAALKTFFQMGAGPVVGKTVEVYALHKNGTEFPVEISISAMNIRGKWQATGVIRDITIRKRIEKELNDAVSQIEKAKKEWEATFDAIKDPIFMHDKEFKIIRANKAYQRMAGMKFKEFIGKSYYEVFPKMDGPLKMCLKAMELQDEEDEEISFIGKTFKVRFFPIKDADERYLYSAHIIEDITEKKGAEEKIKAEMEITTHLLMIAEATSHTTDIDKLMEQVVSCCCSIVGCDLCLSYMWDKERKYFKPSHAAGLSNAQMPLFRSETLDESVGFVNKALDEKGPVVENVGAGLAPAQKGQPQGLPLPWLPNIKTIAAIPLLGHKGRLGFMIAAYNKTREFHQRDMRIMSGISNQVSIALEEARLYRESIDRAMELAHRIEVIQAMHEIDRSILSTLEPQEILETAGRMVSTVIPCDRVTIATVDKDKGGFRYAAGLGAQVLQKLGFVTFDQTTATKILQTGMPEYVPNLKELPDLLLTEKKLLEDGFLSHIRMPITVKGEITGILTVGAKRPSAFTADDLSTLEKLAFLISVAMENARLVTDLQELFIGTLRTLSEAIDAKSTWTRGHSERVTKYALSIAREMGLDEKSLKDLEIAGLLHDVGKIGTYEGILDKPGKLTDEELKMMRQHPGKGAEILAPIKQLKDIIPGIKHHHEFYDGTGYPDVLKGEEIPLMARILSVADTVDAITSDRPYRKGKPMDAIIAELKKCSGAQFDSKVVEAFLKTL